MTLWSWSRTASSNSTADATINWAEGQAPSSVNDSSRAEMAAVAKYRDDIAGAITTGGSSTAYTVTSFQVFDTLAHMSGHQIAFVPHATNGATVTLNVDGLGAKALRGFTGVELLAGVLVAGTPYVATYNNSNSEWLLRGFYADPHNIPLGAMLPYTGSTAPNSCFVLPAGQAISRTTYSAYFSLVGTQYGSGDGSTTFNVIDMRGRTFVILDNLNGSAASRVTSAGSGIDGTNRGAAGGTQTHTLTELELAAHNHNLKIQSSVDGGVNLTTTNFIARRDVGGQAFARDTSDAENTEIITDSGGGGAHLNMQPSIIVACLLRIF